MGDALYITHMFGNMFSAHSWFQYDILISSMAQAADNTASNGTKDDIICWPFFIDLGRSCKSEVYA